MKPKPLVLLNHLTIPVAMRLLFLRVSAGDPGRAITGSEFNGMVGLPGLTAPPLVRLGFPQWIRAGGAYPSHALPAPLPARIPTHANKNPVGPLLHEIKHDVIELSCIPTATSGEAHR